MGDSSSLVGLALPASLPQGGDPALAESLARIEALKIRILRASFQAETEKVELMEELNILRATFLLMGSQGGTRPDGLPPIDLDGEPQRPLGRKDLEIEGIIGRHPVITKNLEVIARLAPTNLTILLEGETGAGKELFSRLVHLNSNRDKLVTVNCGAFPAGVIESELFGHVRGAFTGATADRKGRFEEANGGTIFLDEIGDLEPQAQVKLLRVLDQGEIQRVGSDRVWKTDVRVVSATNRNLKQMVAEGRFREDLFYRLAQCHLFIPPLRERRDEIGILFEYFVKRACARYNRPLPVIDRELARFLFQLHDYPGNIRELKNISEFVALVFDGRPVRIEDLAEDYVAQWRQKAGSDEARPRLALARRNLQDDAERSQLVEALASAAGDVKAARTQLGISRSRIYQLMQKHDVKAADFRRTAAG